MPWVAYKAAEFGWKDGFRMKGDAQRCGERYVELAEKLGHAPGRDEVYEDACRASSPFRPDVFADNDAVAARKWRLEVAGQIIRGIEIVTIRDPSAAERKTGIEVVEVRLPIAQHVEGHGYQMFHEVMTDADLRAAALASIVAGLEQWKAKLQRFETLARDFDKLIIKARALAAREEARARKKK